MTTRTTKKKVTKKATKKVTKKKVTKKTLKRGRPTKYKPEFCDFVIDHLSKGLSYETFGAALPSYGPDYSYVSKQTVYDWEKKHKDFLYAKKEGWVLCQLFWEQQGLNHLTHTKTGTQLNSTVWIFNMKNRFNWADKTEVKSEDTTNKPKKTFAFTLEDEPEK